MKYGVCIECVLICIVGAGLLTKTQKPDVLTSAIVENTENHKPEQDESDQTKSSIKWVDFNVSYEALCLAYEWDVKTYETNYHISWIDLLAYTAARTGGTFNKEALSIINEAAAQLLEETKTIEDLTGDMKYYAYYKEAYSAVLGGLVGAYEVEQEDETGNKSFQKKYGLKGYFPLAGGFEYNHYDDFGAGRSYGYKRKHLGHDMMGQIGTPIVAIESGIVEAIGWNQYGGWRIGIRSLDGSRYYYYAHLRQNYPYAEGLEQGSVITAGDVIGYMGHTGYSTKENVNNIQVTHLHWGLELVFDEKRREEGHEIWVDVYPLTRFLAKHTQQVSKIQGTKEWKRTTDIIDPVLEENKLQQK